MDGSQSFDPDDDDQLFYYRWDFSFDENEGLKTTAYSITEGTRNDNGDVITEPESSLTVTWAQLSQDFDVNGPGEYTVALQVEDSFPVCDPGQIAPCPGQTNYGYGEVRVYAKDPVVDFVINPNPASCGGQVTFDASGSNHPHPDIDIAKYEWEFSGDGQFDDAEGEVVNFRFNQFTFEQNLTVGVRVTDSRGTVSEATQNMVVDAGNRNPVANAGGFRADPNDPLSAVVGPYAIMRGEGLTISANLSEDPDFDCGDDIVKYEWDLNAGDGQNTYEFTTVPDQQGFEQPVALTAQDLQNAGIVDPGTYVIRVRVTDRADNTATGDANLVVTTGPVAIAQATPASQACEQQVEYSGERSEGNGPAGQGFELVKYEWDFEEPLFEDANDVDALGAVISRQVYALKQADGHYVDAWLRVTDASGRVSAPQDVRVQIQDQNLQPVADPGGPYTSGCIGDCAQKNFSVVRLDGRSSVDPNGLCDEIVRYMWDTDGDGLFGDEDNDEVDEVAVVDLDGSGRWNQGTTVQVKLKVCDRENLCSEPQSASIKVLEVSPPSGELVSPRAGDCVGNNAFEVVTEVSDPNPVGNTVKATVEIGGVEVAVVENVGVNANNATEIRIPVAVDAVPEGERQIVVTFTNAQGGESKVDSAGAVLFDRTAPVVTIGDQPQADACYQSINVPDPDITIVDDGDDAPSSSSATSEDGCGRTLTVTAVDACGNEGTASRTYSLVNR